MRRSGPLERQVEQKESSGRQMSKQLAEIAPVEASASAELSKVTDAAIAARLHASLGARISDLYAGELRRLEMTDDVERHTACLARAADIRQEVEALAAQGVADDLEEARLAGHEQALDKALAEATQEEEHAGVERDASLGRASRLISVHEAFVSEGRAKLAEGMASEVAERLLLEGVEAAEARCTQAQQVIISLKEAHAAEVSAARKANEERLGERRVLAAERKALVAARAERRRFLDQQRRALESAEREATAAYASIDGRDASIALGRAQLAQARKEAEKLEGAAAAAEAAQQEARRALDALKSQGRAKVASLRVVFESEASIVDEQRKYVSTLEGRAAREEKAVESSSAATTERKGKRELADASGEAVGAFVATVQAAIAAAEASHQAEGAALLSLEVHAAKRVAALRETLAATREAVVQLAAYESGLTELLAHGNITTDPHAKTFEHKFGGKASGRVSRVSLLSKPDMVAIAVEPHPTTTTSALSSGTDGVTPPPKLEMLRLSAAKGIEVINSTARSLDQMYSESADDLMAPQEGGGALLRSLSSMVKGPVDAMARALTPREVDLKAKAAEAETHVAEAKATAKARAEAQAKAAAPLLASADQ